MLTIIFKCEDGCQEIYCLDKSILRCQCKCGKIMNRFGKYISSKPIITYDTISIGNRKTMSKHRKV